MKEKKIFQRILIAAIGLVLSGIGVGIFLYSGLGVDPASVFQTGLSNTFNITYGNASALSNLIILVIVLIIDKSYINISSFLAVFLIGYTADFTQSMINHIIYTQPVLIIKILMLFIGCFIMSIGIATYIRANLGVGAIDMVSEVISDKCHLDYKKVRISSDIMFVVVGYLLGGILGIGTIFAAFLTGPFVQLVRPHTSKIIDSIITSSYKELES